MCILKSILLVIAIGLLQVAAKAQYFNATYKFVNYTTKDGLADNTINKCIYDGKKYLWVATNNGLNRFNGLSFKKYTFIPGDSTSLRSIWVTDLLLDKNNLLWVSTEWGICYYDEQFDCFRYLNEKNDVQVLYKGPLCNGDKSFIWIAGEDGLKKIDIITKKITSVSLRKIPVPQCIQYDGKDIVWVGTRGYGMFAYNIATDTYKQIYFPVLPKTAHIMGLYDNDTIGLYAATSEGLLEIKNKAEVNLYNKGTGKLSNTVCNELMCITKFDPLLGNDNLLCGAYNGRLFVFDIKQKKFTDQLKNSTENINDYPEGIFFNFFTDKKILWIATSNGLFKLNTGVQDVVSNRLPVLYNTNKKSLLKQIIADNTSPEVIWASLDKPSGGLVKCNTANNTLQQISNGGTTNKDGVVQVYNQLLLDTGKYVWAFSNNGIDRFTMADNAVQYFSIPRPALSADMDALHNYWIGTATGLLYFNTITGASKIFDYSFNGTSVENTSFEEPFPVRSVKDDKQQTVWLTSEKYGLFSFNKISEKFTAYRQPFTGPYETKNRCSAICIDDMGKVWYGTMSGLSCYDPVKKIFVNYDVKDGLQSTYVYSINSIAGEIWGRGNGGVFSFNINNHVCRNYALPPDQNASFYHQKVSFVNGQPVVGFEGGYSTFSNQQANNYADSKAYITGCKVMDQPIYFDQPDSSNHSLVFDYKKNTIRFDFTTIDYDNVDEVNFYYMLEDFDKDWKKADAQSFVVYNNLEPGSYNFKIATSYRNTINEAGASKLAFTILKPFWQTLVFRLFSFLFLAALVFAVYRYRLKQIKKFYEVRSSISRNLHDEIGATLSSINIYSDIARKRITDTNTRQLIDKMYDASARAMESMSDIVWYVNPQNDLLENMLVRMREYALPLLEAKNISIVFTADARVEDIKLNMQQRQQLYLIFKEAVNNLLKYAQAKNVIISINKSKSDVSMSIQDDGQGFNHNSFSSGNGLKNMQFRAKQLKGQLSVDTSVGNGTLVTLQFPIT